MNAHIHARTYVASRFCPHFRIVDFRRFSSKCVAWATPYKPMSAARERRSRELLLLQVPRQRNEMKWNKIKGIHRRQKATHGNRRARWVTIPFYTKPWHIEEPVIPASSSGPRQWWCLQLSCNARHNERPSRSTAHPPTEPTSLCAMRSCVHTFTFS